MVYGKVKDIPENKRKTLLSQLTTTLHWISKRSFYHQYHLTLKNRENNSVTLSISPCFLFWLLLSQCYGHKKHFPFLTPASTDPRQVQTVLHWHYK